MTFIVDYATTSPGVIDNLQNTTFGSLNNHNVYKPYELEEMKAPFGIRNSTVTSVTYTLSTYADISNIEGRQGVCFNLDRF
mmetsp:Transcript_17567/g.29904  ORF Transcript_17567/g.29904 Transcript_17567/m.29904 type:complete len:81 (-) Transcript_17567:121-363(-)